MENVYQVTFGNTLWEFQKREDGHWIIVDVIDRSVQYNVLADAFMHVIEGLEERYAFTRESLTTCQLSREMSQGNYEIINTLFEGTRSERDRLKEQKVELESSLRSTRDALSVANAELRQLRIWVGEMRDSLVARTIVETPDLAALARQDGAGACVVNYADAVAVVDELTERVTSLTARLEHDHTGAPRGQRVPAGNHPRPGRD